MLKTFLAMFWYGEQVLPQPKYTPVVRGVKDSRKLTELKAVVYFFLAWFNHATKSTNSGFCGIKEMQKCNLAKWANNWSISIAKRKSLWTEDSSKKYCRHIYQIKAIVKTFLLNIVSAVFGGDYRLQGTSAEKTPTNIIHHYKHCSMFYFNKEKSLYQLLLMKPFYYYISLVSLDFILVRFFA